MNHQSRHENLTYTALWGMLFLAPLMSLYLRTASNSNLTFDWMEVLFVWQQYVVYLLLFLIHNFLLAPLLIYRQKRWLYLVLVGSMLGCFLLWQCSVKPNRPEKRGPHDREMHERRMFDKEHRDDAEFFDHEPPPVDENGKAISDQDYRPMDNHRPQRHNPPVMIGQHDVISVVILVLMLGMNLGIKLYFKTRSDQKRLIQLEKENLEQQLEYLKYQINPHFFMNTLNNIHALVDIDAEKAKSTILELSKMMRFILYEGDKKGVPLTREFDFIRNYVTLMKLRYTDKVRIAVQLPDEAPDKQIPPLMLITFIENAFKHGISYQHESFINVEVNITDNKLLFTCRNSKADKPNQEKGGVGLTNVKKRLNLLYDHNYTLRIDDEADIYNVQLTIPLV